MYKLEMSVRDYECDMQGIVNNAVYQNYIEHARHEFLKTVDIDFAEYARKGINMIIIRVEIDYKNSLISGDIFEVSVKMEKISRLKFLISQQIIRKSDSKIIINAQVYSTILNAKGRPEIPKEIENKF